MLDRTKKQLFCQADLRKHDANFVRLMEFEAQRARRYYQESAPLLELIDKRSRPSLWAMIQIYRVLLPSMGGN